MNRLFRSMLALCLAVLIIAPVGAQGDNHDYPTLTALEQAVIPARDRVQLAHEFYGIVAPPPPTQPPFYAVGVRQHFNVTDTDRDQIRRIEAEVRALGHYIVLWAEVGYGGTNDEFNRLVQAFDQNIYNKTRSLWGEEISPGVDGDTRVHGLFAYNLGTGLLAYYASEHSYPPEVVSTSNAHEMFMYNLSALGGVSVGSAGLEAVTAHEFQHMIRANIKRNTETWLNEGFSQFTELYLGYGTNDWATRAFLASPSTQLNTWAETGAKAPHYGASFLFVTYFQDRYGLNALRALSDAPESAFSAFDRILREITDDAQDHSTLFADWVLANLLDTYKPAESPYAYQSLRLGFAPAMQQRVSAYPHETGNFLPQYSTHYYALNTPPQGATTLEVQLSTTRNIELFPAPPSTPWMWYSNRADDSVTTLTRAFDLRDLQSATLEYQVWYHLENLWDYGYALISTDGGERWSPLPATPAMTDENPHNNAYGAGYTGRSIQWIDERISLDEFVGQEVLIRFAVITDDATNAPGMVINHVSVPETGYTSAFDAADPTRDGWHAEGWILTDNRLPQYFWVQVAQLAPDGTVTVTRARAWGDEVLTVDLIPQATARYLALSPFAPVTTSPAPYALTIEAR